jgi:hypothetical protein
VSNIINQSRYIVKVARKPGLTCEFPHTKAAEAEAYRATLLAEKGLKAEIRRFTETCRLVRFPVDKFGDFAAGIRRELHARCPLR